MKKLFCLSLLISALSYSQDNYVAGAIGIDVRNAIDGSKPTGGKASLDVLGELIIVKDNHEMCVGYEAFPAIDYSRSYVGYGYHFNWPWNLNIGNKEIPIKFIPRIEPFLLKRIISSSYHWDGYNSKIEDGKTPSFLGVNLNLALQLDVSDNISIQTSLLLGQRPDLIEAYNDKAIKYSGYLKGIYKFN